MEVVPFSNKNYSNHSTETVLIIDMVIRCQPPSNVLRIEDRTRLKGHLNFGLSKICAAFECNYLKTVTYNRTLRGSTSNDIVSESGNTNLNICGKAS